MGTTAGQQTGAGNTGTDAGRGNANESQASQANKDTAAGGQSGQSGGSGGNAGGSQSRSGSVGDLPPQWNRDELNPILRDMAPAQINELFTALLSNRGGGNTNTEQAPVEGRFQRQEEEEVNYKELMDPNSEHYDPEKAMGHYVRKNYGGLITDISSRSLKGLYANLRGQIHDWDSYEQDINTALQSRDPSSVGEADVLRTYFAIKGHRQFLNERKARTQQSSGHTKQPSPDQERVEEEQLDQSEQEVARIMFPRAQDPIAEYKAAKKKYGGIGSDTGPHEVSVPLGDGKRG